MADISVVLSGESKYEIKFSQQITYFSSYGRFFAKIEDSQNSTFDSGKYPRVFDHAEHESDIEISF